MLSMFTLTLSVYVGIVVVSQVIGRIASRL